MSELNTYSVSHPGVMLDTCRAIETPEGVELGLRVAGPAPRFLAWVIDMLIRGAIYIGLSIILALLGRLGIGLLLIVIFLLEWFYPVLFEVYRQGATPGKRSMGLRVMHDDGTPVGWSASLVRNLLRAVDFLPLLYGLGLTSMLLTRDFKRLGDLAAGTLVVYSTQAPAPPSLPVATPQAPPVPLSTQEQRAVVDFAERAALLTPERVGELAGLATPLTGIPNGGAGEYPTGHTPLNPGAQRLFQYANWLVGRR